MVDDRLVTMQVYSFIPWWTTSTLSLV
jgi:hypothetical protein